MSASVGAGQTFSQTYNNYGINAPMMSNAIYEFKVITYNGCGPSAESNIASARTFDIATPTLSVSPSSEFNKVTLSWTGVAGSNGLYNIYGRPQGGNWGDPNQVYVAAGQQYSLTTNAWGILAYMQTNRAYEFYIETRRDSNSHYAHLQQRLRYNRFIRIWLVNRIRRIYYSD